MASLESTDEFLARLKAKDEEKKRVGDKCRKCGEYIFPMLAPGHSRLCRKCRSLDGAEEVRDNLYIRCPRCRANWNPFHDDGCWGKEVLQEGEHDVICAECGQVFGVTTNVTYSFDSPALVAEEGTDGDGS